MVYFEKIKPNKIKSQSEADKNKVPSVCDKCHGKMRRWRPMSLGDKEGRDRDRHF